MSPSTQLLDADAAARRRALEPESFIVEAPAGAGKTELLTQRYLKLLAGVDEPEEIVAITFTLKAAAEMRSRILASLALAAGGVAPEAAHKRLTYDLARAALAAGARRGWNLQREPARLRIMTIDSLCASLARQMPFLSRFGAQPRICDNPAPHYDEAARRTLALLDDEGAAAEAVAEALRHMDNDAARLARLLAQMLARRDQWLRHAVSQGVAAEAEAGLAALVRRDLGAAAACLPGRLQQGLMAAARYAAGNLGVSSPVAILGDWQQPLAADPEELPHWRGLAQLLLTKDGTLRSRLDVRCGFPPGKESDPFKKALLDGIRELAADAAAETAIARIRQLPDPHYTEEEWRTVAALGALLKLAAAQLWSVFLEAGEADFVEVAQRALLALGDDEAPTDLALQLDYRIRHLLVDEFQDTSPTQVALLRRLTAEWSAGDGRTLFAVGDPMQSIYRFRKADVGLFLRVAEGGIGRLAPTRLALARNNRSCAPVVDWVNATFAAVLPARDEVASGAIRYRPFVATREPLPESGVAVHALVAAKDADIDADALEARRILAIVDAERRADPARRIAVLVRARTHLDALVGEIRRHRPDLHFQAVEIEGLAARQPVQDLFSLTRALHHRADRVHWLAILRAPWCGLRLADLHALAGDDFEATIWQLMNDAARCERLSADGAARLGHVRAVLAEALAHQGRQPPRRWIEGAWLKLGGPRCLAGAGDALDAKAFLDLVDRLDAAGRFSLEALEEEMARLYAAPDPGADAGLQFMTVHKAKGLEFDTVILPGLHRRNRGDDPPLMLWEEVALEGLDECLVAAPLPRRGIRGDVPTPYDALRRLEKERADNEMARVLYVAATRAVRRLHLVAVAGPNAKGEIVAPGGTPLALLWPALAAEFEQAAPAEPLGSSSPDAAAFVPKLVRLAQPGVPAALGAAPGSAAAMPETVGEEEEGTGNALDADVGTLVHRYLEIIAGSGPDAWPAERIRALRPAMRLWLERAGHGAAEAGAGSERAEAALLATLASDDGRWVLAPRQGAAAELALSDYDGRRIANHVVDRTFADGGVRWIVDYKTARVAADADLAAHAERYRPQLERYAALFRDEGLPVRAAIFYTATARLVAFPPLEPPCP